MIIGRRALLRGMFAAPAIVAASSLMPLRGIRLLDADDIVWQSTSPGVEWRHLVVYDPGKGVVLATFDLDAVGIIADGDTLRLPGGQLRLT